MGAGDDEGHLLEMVGRAGRSFDRPPSVDEKRPLDMSAESSQVLPPEASTATEPTSPTLVRVRCAPSYAPGAAPP